MRLFIIKILLLFCANVSLAQVYADFTVNSTNGCAPFTVKFLDISSNGATDWIWDFGNGNKSYEQNPTFIYVQPGFYTVILTASNDTSLDVETKSALIQVNAAPEPNFNVDKEKGCSPHIAQFTDLSIPQSGTITQWYWAFGNGEISILQNPVTNFTEIKKYNVYLQVTDVNGCQSNITKNSLIELDKPKANFEYDSVICGLPAKVLFLNQSDPGNNLNYYWEFGDGQTSTSEIPGVHTYTSFDSTEVLLAVTEESTGCSDTIKRSLVVGNYEATFDYNIICGDDEFTIEVENTTPFFTKLEWDFNGESGRVFGDKVSFHFNSGGVKDIILTSTIDESCYDTTLLKYTLPSPSFTYDAPKCSDPFEVTFTNTSKGDEMIYFWDFKDSTFSNDVSPYHEFNVPPERYLVKLYAEDQFGCLDSSNTWVNVPFPIARFYEKDSIYTGCSPLNLTFFDTSYTLSSKIASVKWDFGDPNSGSNNTSISTSPSHNYNAPGDYDITYTIYTEDGCADTAIYKAAIKAGEKPSAANFEQLLNDTICYGNSIEFVEQTTYATNNIQSNYFCWSFYEDNNPLLIQEEKKPINCPSSIQNYSSNNNFVNYSNPSHRYLDFKTESTLIGDTFFTNNVNPNAGLLYTHLIIGYNNCYSEVIKSNFIDTTIAVIGIAVKDSLVMFSDTTKTFGFFNASLNYDSVEFSYCRDNLSIDTLFKITKDTNYFELQEGHKYNIYTKIVNKTSGCENTIADQIVIDSVRIDFEMVDNQCYSNNPVLLDENSFSKYGDVTRRSWSVNGEIQVYNASDDSLYYNFPDTGVFNVSLEMEYRIQYLQNGIKSYNYYTKSVSKQIKIEGVKAKGLTDTLKVCGGDTIFFTDSSTSTTLINSYRWRFGYSTDSLTVNNPYHIYNDPGTFTPSLYVTDIFGCYDSISLPTITVNRPIINFTISDSLICKYDVVALKNKSEGKNLSFKWTINTIKQSSPDIEHKFDSVGEFDVKLYAIDIFGCEDTLVKYKTIKVEGFPETNFEGDSLYKNCPPLASSFKNSTLTPVLKWNWDFGDGSTSNNQHPTHVFTTPGFYDVQLITTNYAGCSDTLKQANFVEVNGPNGSVNSNYNELCIPDAVVFKHELQNTVYFIWDYGDGYIKNYNYSDNTDSTTHTYLSGGEFQPNIKLIGAKGCIYKLPKLPIITGDSIATNFKTSDSIICDLLNIPFKNTSRETLKSSYIWKFGNGDSSITNSPIYSYQTESIYEVTLIQTSPLGCADSISKSIQVLNAPLPILGIKNTSFCVPSISDVKIEFENDNFISDSVYFFIDGNHFSSDSLQTVILNDGNHDFRYIIEYGSGACTIDSLTKVPFYKWPIASFDFQTSNNSADEPVIFFNNTSKNSNSWLWDFDDSSQSSITENPGHNFYNKGLYNVSLISNSLGGCADTATALLTIAPYNFVKLPNAFSPNGDGQNETFGILRAGELEIQEFKIYNRWGNIVFETTDKDQSWNGKRKGKDQNTGTYIYYIKGNDKDGEVIEIKGNFSLLR